MVTITREATKAELREMLYEQILATGPEHFNQNSWHVGANYDATVSLGSAYGETFESCGTTACIAGHGAALLGRLKATPPYSRNSDDHIADTFGLDVRAFRTSAERASWPQVMRYAYDASMLVNDNERDAEWWAALRYLISLRDVKD